MAHGVAHAPAPAVARRPRLAAVAALALAAAALSVAIASSGGRSSEGSWQKTFAATNGPHVVVSGLPGVALDGLADLPGLAASSGPFPGLDTSLRHRGRELDVRLEARPATSSAVDRPLMVTGEWVRPGTVVLERSTARALGVPLGGRVAAAAAGGKVHLTLGGVTETSARERYPGAGRGLGLGYVLSDTLAGVGPKATHGSSMLLRLADPDRAGKYVDWIRQRYPGAQVAVAAPSP